MLDFVRHSQPDKQKEFQMRMGIIRLPYNTDVFGQVVQNLTNFDGEIVFIDEPATIDRLRDYALPPNCSFQRVDLRSNDALVSLCKALQPNNVLSFAELGLMPAARVRTSLGMWGHGVDTELASVDKYTMRTTLAEHGLTSVATRKVAVAQLSEALAQARLPVIVKPASLTGSIGVQLIERLDQVDDYIARLSRNEMAKECDLVIETYLPGDEYSVEGLLLDGEVYIYGVTEKSTTGAPYFVETGHAFHAEHPLISPLQVQLPRIFAALGMSLCPFHVEFKMHDGEVEIIELHSRFGGDLITKLIEVSLGNEVFLEYVNYLAYGARPIIDRTDRAIAAIHFVTCGPGTIESIDLFDTAGSDWIEDHKSAAAVGDRVTPAVGYYERLAHFIYKANTPQIESQRRNLLAESAIVAR
jgi:biotin carboxylase